MTALVCKHNMRGCPCDEWLMPTFSTGSRWSRRNIDFYPVVFGDRGKEFDVEHRDLNALFASDRERFSKHNVIPKDLAALAQMMDSNFEKLVGAIQIATGSWPFGPIQTKPGLYLALVPASALTRLRKEHDLAMYHSSFRFMLGPTPVWKGMTITLKNPIERKFFHLYHNGITILGHNIAAEQGQLRIEGLQVINGLQTIETLFDFATKGANGKSGDLSDVCVFTRFIDLDTHASSSPNTQTRSLDEKIAEYSNKQNPITSRDLRSNDLVQKRLQHEIDCLGYKYERKRGQFGRNTRNVVKNDELAQEAVSFWLKEPQEVKNKKILLFLKDIDSEEGFYDKVFFKDVPSSALLIPHELYDRIPPQKSDFARTVVRNGNLIPLAMFGDVFCERYGLTLAQSSSAKNRNILEEFYGKVRSGDIDKEVNQVWKGLVSRLVKMTRSEINRRKKEEGWSEVPIRNVLVGYRYLLKRRDLMPITAVKKLASKLPRI
jgi:hypothetical protein